VHVETCFAPLLAWKLSGCQGRQRAIALDATPLGQRCVVLAISVVSRCCAMLVAWVVLEAGKKGLAPGGLCAWGAVVYLSI
jgi:hypothetical protein